MFCLYIDFLALVVLVCRDCYLKPLHVNESFLRIVPIVLSGKYAAYYQLPVFVELVEISLI